SMLSSRLNAFVIPTSHRSPMPHARTAPDELDLEAARDDDHRGGELRRELREDVQVPEVVDEAGREEEGDSGENPDELAARGDRSGSEREEDADRKPGIDANTPE